MIRYRHKAASQTWRLCLHGGQFLLQPFDKVTLMKWTLGMVLVTAMLGGGLLSSWSRLAVAEDTPDANAKKDAEVAQKWKSLFDGKTLDGWVGFEDLWSVKDGAIVAKNTDPLK